MPLSELIVPLFIVPHPNHRRQPPHFAKCGGSDASRVCPLKIQTSVKGLSPLMILRDRHSLRPPFRHILQYVKWRAGMGLPKGLSPEIMSPRDSNEALRACPPRNPFLTHIAICEGTSGDGAAEGSVPSRFKQASRVCPPLMIPLPDTYCNM